MPASRDARHFSGISRAVRILSIGSSASLLLTLAGFTAQAHHSVIGMYDPEMQVTVTGVIVEFHFERPHPYMVLDVEPNTGAGTSPDSAEQWRWHLEFDNFRELANIGVVADTFSPGDEVVVTGDYARDGRESMYVRELLRPKDGLLYECPGFRPSLKVVR